MLTPERPCACGCGESLAKAKARFILNHDKRRPLSVRFWEKVNKTDSCWLWTGSIDRNGYGRFAPTSRANRKAHRVAYELAVGAIPEGLELDHLCRVRSCVNPSHLEAVTRAENIHRQNSGVSNVDTCRNGLHPWPESRIYRGKKRIQAMCGPCAKERGRRETEKRQGARSVV